MTLVTSAPASVLAHEVSGGAGAATISVIASFVMAGVLLILLLIVFVRRAGGDEERSGQ
jgi:hypothetical protein